MSSPLQNRAYELLIRTATAEIDMVGDWRIEAVMRHLFASATELGSTMERANSAPSREQFRSFLHDVHSNVRQVKLWLKVLDDLGRIAPEVATPIHAAAEEVHRLVLSALKTSGDAKAPRGNGVSLVKT